MSEFDQNTHKIILPDNIVHTTDTDYVVAEENAWRLVPKVSVESDKTVTISEAIPNHTDISNVRNELPDEITKVSFSFGFKNLVPQYKSFHKMSGIVTGNIDMTNSRYVEIDSDIEESENSSIECTILDGNTERPILPRSLTKVSNERMFVGLPTRFEIDRSKPILIKKNGADFLSSDLEFDKHLLDDTSNTYTISYTPVNPYRIAVSSTSMRLKVIVRVYENGYPPAIRNMTILKSGGVLQWQI